MDNIAIHLATLEANAKSEGNPIPDIGHYRTSGRTCINDADFTVPTLDSAIELPATPMLRALFHYTNGWSDGIVYFLPLEAMKSPLEEAFIAEVVDSHRVYWEASAPMLYPESRISILGSLGPPLTEDLIYLVWQKNREVEPEVWAHQSQSASRFRHLEDYLGFWLGLAEPIDWDDPAYPLPQP